MPTNKMSTKIPRVKRDYIKVCTYFQQMSLTGKQFKMRTVDRGTAIAIAS